MTLDGVTYDIDLRPENAAKLRDALSGFVLSARSTRGRAKKSPNAIRTVVAESRTKEQTKAIRDWARANDHELSDRGRIPTHVIEEFEKAHRA